MVNRFNGPEAINRTLWGAWKLPVGEVTNNNDEMFIDMVGNESYIKTAKDMQEGFPAVDAVING